MSVTSEHAEAGFLGECPFCGESVWEDEDYGTTFHHWCHKACAEEVDADMAALAEQGE